MLNTAGEAVLVFLRDNILFVNETASTQNSLYRQLQVVHRLRVGVSSSSIRFHAAAAGAVIVYFICQHRAIALVLVVSLMKDLHLSLVNAVSPPR